MQQVNIDDHTKELDILANICQANLNNSDKCKEYLKSRGISSKAITDFKIGFFPQNVSTLIKYVSDETLRKLTIIDYSENSYFSDFFYLVFPIISEYGDTEAIAGRTLLGDNEREVLGLPKYKNSSYKKSRNLYGLNLARPYILERQNVFVVEGQLDTITMHDNGICNTVAICGASFSKRHFLSIAKYTNKITFVMDNDEAGLKAARTIKKKFSNRGVSIRFLKSPNGIKDANEYFALEKTKQNFVEEFKFFNPGL